MFFKPQPVHFVGIGGIGMSGLAEILLEMGYPRERLGSAIFPRSPKVWRSAGRSFIRAMRPRTSADAKARGGQLRGPRRTIPKSPKRGGEASP